jgi:DNA-binding transcriptional regulator YhcF (GntR family)
VITVQRAYEALLREDLIHSRRGKGFFVALLHDSRRKDMAKRKLVDSIAPVIAAALAEGLASKDILAAVQAVLKEHR